MLDKFGLKKKHILVISVVALIVIAFLVRLPFIGHESSDFVRFLLPWYAHLQEHGFAAFSAAFADYNFPYLFILWVLAALHLPPLESIKIVSFLFEIAIAVAIYLILRHFRPKGSVPIIGAIGALFLPTVIMNSSVWAQCDAIYVAFVLFSFYAALKDRRVAMWLLWGVAITFKLQAIFFLPVLVYLWLTSKKSRMYDPLLPFVPFVIGLLPPLVAGQPLDSVLSVYFVQGVVYSLLSANAASIFGLFPLGPAGFIPLGRLIAIAAAGSLLVFALLKMRMDRQKTALLAFATVSVLLLPFLLPQMHERYFYLAEIFSLLLACVSIRMLWVATAVQFASAVTYLVEFLNEDPLPIALPILSLVMAVALGGLIVYFVKYHSTVKWKT